MNSYSMNKESHTGLLESLLGRSEFSQEIKAAGLDQDPAILKSIEELLLNALKEKRAQLQIGEFENYPAKDESSPEDDLPDDTTRFHPAVLWFESRSDFALTDRYRDRLEKIRSHLQNVEGDFGELAITNTEHRSSRHRGGSFGWMTEGKQYDPVRNAVASIAAKLQPGELSPVTVRREGIFLVRLIERQESRHQADTEFSIDS